MNELENIIKTIISTELEQDSTVVDDSFVLAPVINESVLKGDGRPTEITTSYQLDVFFKGKGELVSKSNSLAYALADYPMTRWDYTWEEVARVWRGTTQIEKI